MLWLGIVGFFLLILLAYFIDLMITFIRAFEGFAENFREWKELWEGERGIRENLRRVVYDGDKALEDLNKLRDGFAAISRQEDDTNTP